MANDKKFIAKNGIQGLDASVFTSITTSGKVGVGTASPVAGLDVLGTIGYTGTIHNHAYASGEGARIFGDEATLDLLGTDSGDHSSSVYFRNGTEGFAWINDPDSNSFQLRSFTSTGNDFSAHGTGAAVSNLVSILDIDKTGNVGIGTDAPGEKLDVNGDVRVRGSGGTIGGANIANSALLVGSTTTGIGIDSNEIYSKGDPLYIGVLDAEDIIFRYGTIKLVTIQSGGNVGIGTGTPARQVHIHDASGDNNFHITNSTTGTTASDGFSIVSQSTTNDVLFNQRETANMRFFTANDEKMRIDSSGNIGIGTVNPYNKLHVNGNGRINNLLVGNSSAVNTPTTTAGLHIKSSGNDTVFRMEDSDGANSVWDFLVNNSSGLSFQYRGTSAANAASTYLFVSEAGTLSVGSAFNPGAALTVDGTGGQSSTSSTMVLYDNRTTAADVGGSIVFSFDWNGTNGHLGSAPYIKGYKLNASTSDYSSGLRFGTRKNGVGENAVAMTINEDQKVGIGETSPLGKLHVKDGDAGSITTNGAHDTIIVEGSANTGINIFSPDTSYQYLAFGDPGGSNRGYVRYQHSIDQMVLRAGGTDTVFINGGNVGIGSNNPQDPLVVKSSGTMGGAVTNANSYFTITDGTTSLFHDPNELVSDVTGSFHIAANNAAGELQFQTGGTTVRMQIKSDGKVGIGTVIPSNVLHVHGSDSGITVSSDASDRPHIRLVNGTAEMLRLSANNLYGAIGDSSNSQRYMVFKNDFIGTNTQTAPNAQIHIGTATAEGTATNPALQIGGANTYRLGFYTEAELGIIDAANGDNGLAIHTKTIGEAVRIDADGQVGIGTNNPFSKLNVHGNNNRLAFGAVTANLAAQHRIEFWETPASASVTDSNYAIEYDGTATYGGDGALLFRGYGSAANQMYAGINRQGTTFLGMEGATPRVGIGTTNPTNKLDIRGNVTQIDSSPEYHFATSSATHYNWRIAAQEQVDQGFEIASGELTAGTSADSNTYTNRFVINANGNIGIGTNSPDALLHVQHTSVNKAFIVANRYNDTSTGSEFRSIFAVAEADPHSAGTTATIIGNHNRHIHIGPYFGLDGTTNAVGGLTILSTGNFGIGNSAPDQKLTIGVDNSSSNVGYIRLRGHNALESNIYKSADYGIHMDTDSNSQGIRIDGGKLVLGMTGNVGIGTTTPTAKLHIVSDLALRLYTATNGAGTKINFSDHAAGSYAQNGTLEYVHSDTVSFGSGNAFKFFGSESTMTLHIAGDVKATNDVTAYYSDPRLKDFHGNITGALDKVNSLGGYYFTENARAKELGYTNDRMQVGVNAAEVEEILPEVVTLAAIDDPANYKTVKYEKMVPLLIEAIKELTEQNMEMKQRLDKLEGEA